MDKTIPHSFDDLPSLYEFCKHIDKNIQQLYLRERLGGKLVDRLEIPIALRYYGKCKVFNYYKRSPQILDVFIKTFKPPRYPQDAFLESEFPKDPD